MAKAPILNRITFQVQVRPFIQNPPLYRSLEWNVVETELGTMVEPRQGPYMGDASGKTVNMDVSDMGFNGTRLIEDESVFQNQYGTGGNGLTDFNVPG